VDLIDVTIEDIEQGTRKSRQSCMMALAFRRRYGNRFVGCGMRSVSLFDPALRWVHERQLPQIAIDAIYHFESGVRKVYPFSFEFKS
jgi:hypothetical protein